MGWTSMCNRWIISSSIMLRKHSSVGDSIRGHTVIHRVRVYSSHSKQHFDITDLSWRDQSKPKSFFFASWDIIPLWFDGVKRRSSVIPASSHIQKIIFRTWTQMLNRLKHFRRLEPDAIPVSFAPEGNQADTSPGWCFLTMSTKLSFVGYRFMVVFKLQASKIRPISERSRLKTWLRLRSSWLTVIKLTH